MALPSQIDSTSPAGSASPSLGDDQIRALKLFLEDLLGIPTATNISNPGLNFVAGGMDRIIFQDFAASPTVAGRLNRNGANLEYYNTAARILYMQAGTDVALADGGTAASLTASNGGIVYSTASALAILAGTATANQALLSGLSTTPAWSTATYPATTTINRLLYSSSANVIADLATANSGVLVTSGTGVPSIATDIPTAVTIGTAYVYRVGGTDVAVADGGTGLSTIAINRILYASAADVIAALATANSGVLVTSGTGVPSIATDIPTAVTIGTAYVYRIGGTDVAVADGGTNLSSGTSGGILGYTATGVLASSVLLTANGLLLGGGAGATPTSLGAATNGQLPIGSTGVAPVLAAITAGAGITVTNAAGSITIAAISGLTTVRKTLDESLASSTTLQNDDALLFAVSASTNYMFFGAILAEGPAAGDIKLSFTVPASATLVGGYHGSNTTRSDLQDAQMSGAPTFGVLASPDAILITFWGTVTVAGTAGDVTLQWAQNVSDGTNTTVKAGSFISYAKI